MSSEERHSVLQTISLGVLDESELKDIAPELRIPNFFMLWRIVSKFQLLYHEVLEERSATSSASSIVRR